MVAAVGVGGGARRHRAAKHNLKRGRSAPPSQAVRAVGHRAGLEFSERPRDGFLGRIRFFWLTSSPALP
jgi:hypothetical protein